MEFSAGNISAATAEPASDLKYFYSKRNSPGDSTATRPSSPMSGQSLQPVAGYPLHPPHAPNYDMFELGRFYEIDHSQLLPKFPIHLKDVRVVKVTEITSLNMTVSFPSAFSLRKCFGEEKTPVEVEGEAAPPCPDLDEQFVMSLDRAGKVLRRLIPLVEVERGMHMESFWLEAPKEEEHESILYADEAEEEEEKEEGEGGDIPAESCLLILKRSGAIDWGVRRKITYIGRRREESSSQGAVIQEEKKGMQTGAAGRKRTREMPRKKKKKKEEKSFKRSKLEKGRASDRKGLKAPKDRWSTERYRAAELKLLEIMKEKGAALGNPILRPELREEARKHIGDTGLLDHLLKHMAGKVVSEGKDRFRRRHNPEGAMEYWLEAAELQELRRSAGVMDPFWMPPPGWKPGDSISPCGVICGQEIERLKEELGSLRREIEWTRSLKVEEKELQNASILELQESYESLTKSNANLEEKVTAMAGSLKAVQEELLLLKSDKERKELERRREEKMGRRSGFRICKPEGTFLWPNMASSGNTNGSTTTASSPTAAGEEPFGVPPTPHSASSATSPRSLPIIGVSAGAAPRAHVVVLAPRPHLLAQALSGERTDSSDNLCSPVLPCLTKVSSRPAYCDGKSAATAAWESDDRAGGWRRTISTDLALSSPCYHR